MNKIILVWCAPPSRSLVWCGPPPEALCGVAPPPPGGLLGGLFGVEVS